MTDNRDAPSEDDRAVPKRRAFSPFDGSVGTIATVVIAITAVLTLVLNYTQGGPAASGPATAALPPQSATETSALLPSQSTTETPTALPSFSDSDSAFGTVEAQPASALGCWIGDTQISCEAEHNTEVVDMGACTRDGLVKFMGGTPSLDVLRNALTVESTESGCSIRGIEPRTKQSLSGILDGSAGDAYRKCWVKSTDSEVACDEPHFAEQIYSGTVESVDCEQRFADYVGQGLERFAQQLEVEANPGATTTCWVKTRVSNELIASLRNLKDRPLPFQD